MRNGLARDLLAWMAEGIPPPGTRPDEARFTTLALRVFAYQFEANAPYRRFCERRGARPDSIHDWRDIPAVATDAFKEVPLTCFPPEQAAAVFVTSGTTRQVQRGRHYLRSLEMYEASLLPTFEAFVLPDGARLPAVILGFSPGAMPESSLSHMFGVVVERLSPDRTGSGAGPRGDGHTYFVGPEGIDIDGAVARLTALEAAGQPVLLMGTAFAFVHLVDHLAARSRRLHLPPGSRVMDTGGYKGRSREAPKAELYALYTDLLGIPHHHIINEYGMTEMASQFYDDVRDALSSSLFSLPSSLRPPLTPDTRLPTPRTKCPPPWVRTLVVDPETLAPLPHGHTGVLRHFDLANLDSVMALQTADLGVASEHGFDILGRAAGAEARGCSLAVEELLRAQRP
jgi:hypothetical protein